MNHANFTTEFVLETKNFRDPWFWLPLCMLMLLVVLSLYAPFNKGATLLLNHNLANQSDLSDQLWLFLSIIAEGTIIIPLGLALCLLRPRLLFGYTMTMVTSSLLALSFSILADMNGPTVALQNQINTIGQHSAAWSFPSEQATWVSAALGFIYFHNKQAWLRVLLLCVVLATISSRIILGAHWVLDVVVGAFIGWLCAYGGFLIALSIPLMFPKGLLYGMVCTNCIFGVLSAVFYVHPLNSLVPQYGIAACIVGLSGWFVYKLMYDKGFLQPKSTYH